MALLSPSARSSAAAILYPNWNTRPAAGYTAFEILSLTEGTLAPVTCLETGQQCENAKNCRTLPLWQGLDRTIADYLGRYTLADLARMEKEP